MKATESDIESSIVIQLQTLGWQPDQRKSGRDVFRQSPKTDEEKKKLGRLRPDFVLYARADSGKPTVVIEAKKQSKTLAAGLEQAVKYAELLGAPIAVATDGYRLKTWHIRHKSPLIYNDREVDELFPKKLARHFTDNPIYSSFTKREALGKKDLIGKFKQANDILRAEGLDAGIVRFSEFANLMFLRLRLEGGGDISGHTWSDLENKRGNALLDAVKSMLSFMKREHSGLFEQTKIKTPARLESLIGILSSFRLSGVRDDVKGMAFETFIHSYTQGLRNDLGQYFTPRHIIKLMVDYLRPRLGETIYDPFCGTGGMLIECFRYIQQHGGGARPEDRKVLCEKTVYGRDNSSVARIAMMNMIMFGDGHSNIEQGDSYREAAGRKYDIVITNIPFSQTTEFHAGYPVPPSGAKNGDSIGVQHCLASMSGGANARAAIIVPIGFVYKDELQREREYISENFALEQVVELTPKCFNPYTEQQTAILMLRRRRSAGRTVYYHVKNDGFSQDGYRVQIPGHNDIDKVMEKEGGRPVDIGRADGWKYKKIAVLLKRGEKKLGELAVIRCGDGISPKTMLRYTIGGRHPIVMVADLAARHIDYCLDEIGARINDKAVEVKRPHLYPPKTIVIPTSGKAVLLNHRALLEAGAYLSATVTGITANSGVHPYYLFYWLLHWDAETATYDLGYPGLSVGALQDIAIPMVSPEKQKKIIDSVANAVKKQREFKKQHRAIMGK